MDKVVERELLSEPCCNRISSARESMVSEVFSRNTSAPGSGRTENSSKATMYLSTKTIVQCSAIGLMNLEIQTMEAC